MAVQLTPGLLLAATGCTPKRAVQYAQHLADACRAYGIDTPQRLAAFLAQIGHESGALAHVVEVWGPTPAQQRYEGRADLGNTEPGDGSRYRGRGLIQTTGRANHAAVRDRLRRRLGADVPDFEAEPERLEEPRWAAWSAADYWEWRGLNALADAGEFEQITRRINGGLNGLADRRQRWERAKQALGAPQPERQSPAPIETIPIPRDTTPRGPTQEKPMALPVILKGLASVLIQAMTPLAAEKLTKEMSRYTDDSKVAEQITATVIEAAKAATGQADAVQAVAQAQASPDVMQRVEEDVMARVAALTPLLDRLAELDEAQHRRSEASRDAAAARARTEGKDLDEYLTRSLLRLFAGVLVVGALLTAGLAYLGVDVQMIVGALLSLVGLVGGKFSQRYDYRYGSSSGSAAKEVTIAEMSRR